MARQGDALRDREYPPGAESALDASDRRHHDPVAERGDDANQHRALAAESCEMTVTLRRDTNHRTRETTAGFTLIEALIATAMMGMILTALATITGQWLPNWNRGIAYVQRSEHVALGLERVASDLAAAEFIPPMQGARGPYFEGTDRTVTFVRTALNPNTVPALEIVRFSESDSGKGVVLVRSRLPFVPLTGGTDKRVQLTFADPVVLLRSPWRLSFSYSGSDRIWHEAWREQAFLPKAVRLSVHDAATQRSLSISTAVLIRAGLPIECVAAKTYDDCLDSYQKSTEPSEHAASRALRDGRMQ
jgi:general secretion pathway protein J